MLLTSRFAPYPVPRTQDHTLRLLVESVLPVDQTPTRLQSELAPDEQVAWPSLRRGFFHVYASRHCPGSLDLMLELAQAHQSSLIASAISDGNAAVSSSSTLDDGIAGGVEGRLFVARDMQSLQTAQPMLAPITAPGTAPGSSPHRPTEMLHVTSDETLLPKCSHMLVYVHA